MNSIKRFTKRVKHNVLALCLDVRGAESMASPLVILTTGAGVVATAVAAQHAFGQTKSTLDTQASASDKLGSTLSSGVGGTPEATPAAVSFAGGTSQ